MSAASVPWNTDFQLDDKGSTIVVHGDQAYVERLIRRLLTTPRLFDVNTGAPVGTPDYIFEPKFGAGLRRLVGNPMTSDELVRLTTPQIMADPETSTGTRPKITAAIYPDGVVLLNIIAVRVPNKVINFGLRIG